MSGLTVALVGADGAGKSTISRRLEQAPLAFSVRTIYMGVNLEASTLMLPTTRLLLAAKRARGGRPDMVASMARDRPDGPPAARGWRRSLRDGVRMSAWMVEEWFRQLIAFGYGVRGHVVVFDRHFFADYYHPHVADTQEGRGLAGRAHGWMLAHAYPKPDLVICLDAPAEVLYSRKAEASVGWLEQRRQQYLDLATVVPAFVTIDVDRDQDAVFHDVVAAIDTYRKGLNA